MKNLSRNRVSLDEEIHNKFCKSSGSAFALADRGLRCPSARFYLRSWFPNKMFQRQLRPFYTLCQISTRSRLFPDRSAGRNFGRTVEWKKEDRPNQGGGVLVFCGTPTPTL